VAGSSAPRAYRTSRLETEFTNIRDTGQVPAFRNGAVRVHLYTMTLARVALEEYHEEITHGDCWSAQTSLVICSTPWQAPR
jgi:hypothetical protein